MSTEQLSEPKPTPTQTASDEINKTLHVKFMHYMYHVLPEPYSSQDCNRLTLMYFVIGGLDLLGELDKYDKKNIIEFVYNLQVHPDKDDFEKNLANVGFRGGNYFGNPYNPNPEPQSLHAYDQSHIAMTYTALAILTMCGDDLSRVNKKGVIAALRHLQLEDGSFCPASGRSENDMRFVYCAAVISHMLNDWSGVDVDKAVKYIIRSQSYDGAIGQGPGQESHGGSTYCAVAALALMGRLNELPRKDHLIQWCCERQISGFQGRINKPADSCYSFWIGSTLTLLGAYELADFPIIKAFTQSCETKRGGYGKMPGVHPDVLHTYMSLAGMSLGGQPGIEPIDPALGFSKRAVALIEQQRQHQM